MKLYFLLSLLVATSAQGFPSSVGSEVSLQESIAYSQWLTKKYTVLMIPLPGVYDGVDNIRFIRNDQSAAIEFRKSINEITLYKNTYYCYFYDIKNSVYEEVTRDNFHKQLDVDFYQCCLHEMKRLGIPYIKHELNLKQYEGRKFSCVISSNYRMFACVVNNKYLVLLKLYEELPVREMRKLHDVNFCFAKVD